MINISKDISGPEFVELMERHGIRPRDLGITPAYKAQLKRGLRRPSRQLIEKIFELISTPQHFVEFMERCGLKPKDLGITSRSVSYTHLTLPTN